MRLNLLKALSRMPIAHTGPGNGVSRVCVHAGRILVLMIAALLVVMPWTEYFWSFDRFLRGGQDFELGLLAVLSILCLIVVLLQRGKTDFVWLLTLARGIRPRWLPLVLRRAFPSVSRYASLVAIWLSRQLPQPEVHRFHSPIQV